MTDTSVVFNILAKDNASGVFGKVGDAIGNVASRAAGFVTGTVAVDALSKAFDFAKTAVFGFNSTVQNSQIAFTTMLGSGQKAQTFLDDLKAFAKKTPFEFEGLVKNAQNMMGMGIAAKDVIPDLTALGDSVASIGGSADQVDQVTLAFDQMSAKGTLDMGNMNQLLQGGVPNALKILAAAYGKTTGQMIDMISTGKVQSADALPKLIAGLEHGTSATAALGGMMDKQSQTFSGALSNISDGLTQAASGAFKPFFDLASSGAQQLGTFFSSDTFSKFGDKVSGGISSVLGKAQAFAKGVDLGPILSAFGHVRDFVVKDLVPAGKDLYDTFGPLIKTAFTDAYNAIGPISSALSPVGAVIKDIFGFVDKHKTLFQGLAVGVGAVVAAMTAWNIVMGIWKGVQTAAIALQVAWDAAMDANPIGLIILAIVGLVAAFAYLWTHSAAFRDFWIGLWDAIWGFLKGIGHWFAHDFVDFFKNAWHWIQDKATEFHDFIVGKFQALVGFVTSIPGKIRAAASGMWDGIKDAFKSAVNWLIGRWNALHLSIPSIDFLGMHIGGFTLSLPQVPYLAAGGIVPATQGGRLAVLGEGGEDEAVIPLSKLGGGGAGGGTRAVEMRVRGDADSRLATFLHNLARDGILQFAFVE